MRDCRCNSCGRTVQGQPKNWKKLINEFGGIGQLRAAFKCARCRHYQRENPLEWALTKSKPIKRLVKDIRAEMVCFEKNKYNLDFPMRAERFKLEIQRILSMRFIKNYEFVVADNRLVAILVKEVPFVQNFTIKLYETNPQKE